MIKNKISRVVVIRGNEIVGIVTSRDFMPITTFVEGDDDGVESKDLSGIGYIMLVRDVMNKPIIINKNTDLAEAAQIMHDKGISGIPVGSSIYSYSLIKFGRLTIALNITFTVHKE